MPAAITGLQVAPTAPSAIDRVSSSTDAESFHKHVGVVCVIWCSKLLYETPCARAVMVVPDRTAGLSRTLSPSQGRPSSWLGRDLESC